MAKKGKFWFIFGIILMIVGFISIILAAILQRVEILKVYGTYSPYLYVEHWSAWLYMGAIPTLIGGIILYKVDY